MSDDLEIKVVEPEVTVGEDVGSAPEAPAEAPAEAPEAAPAEVATDAPDTLSVSV